MDRQRALAAKWPGIEGFVLTSGLGLGPSIADGEVRLGVPLVRRSSDASDGEALARRLLQVNNYLYGDLAMPAWVMLDLALLPSSFVGLAGPARHLRAEVRAALGLVDDEERVPFAAFCAAATHQAGTVVGWSLVSLVPRAGLATLAKALALACYGARRQVGVTQYDNASLGVHTRFGPLRIVRAQVPLHTRARSSFVYELSGLDDAQLERAVDEAPPHATVDRLVRADDTAALDQLDGEIRAGERWAVVAPGLVDGRACLARQP